MQIQVPHYRNLHCKNKSVHVTLKHCMTVTRWHFSHCIHAKVKWQKFETKTIFSSLTYRDSSPKNDNLAIIYLPSCLFDFHSSVENHIFILRILFFHTDFSVLGELSLYPMLYLKQQLLYKSRTPCSSFGDVYFNSTWIILVKVLRW